MCVWMSTGEGYKENFSYIWLGGEQVRRRFSDRGKLSGVALFFCFLFGRGYCIMKYIYFCFHGGE